MRTFLLLAVVATTGCAPTLGQLVDQKHYREAVCAAVDEGAEDEVADALSDDANLHVHLHRVTRQELEPVLGPEAAADVQQRAQFVRVRLQSNAIPVDDYAVRVAFEGTPSAPVDWKSLAFATGETLPPKVRGQTYATARNLGVGTAAVFTLGLSLFVTGGFKPGTRLYQAPRSDYLSWAPHATALHDEMARSHTCPSLGGGSHQQKRCDLFFVLEPGNLDGTLSVDQTFASKRVSVGRDDVCRVEHTAQVPLAEVDFGLEMQPLTRIATR